MLVESRPNMPELSLYKKGKLDKDTLRQLGQISADAIRTADSPANHDEDILGQFAERAGKFDIIIVAREGAEIVGYGGYRVLKVREGARRLIRSIVLYESAKMMKPSKQGKGYGKQISKRAMGYVKPEYVAVRTQNPNEASSLQSSLPGVTLAPLAFDYSEAPRLENMLVKTAQVLGAADKLEKTRDNSGKVHYTGVLKGMYGSKFGEHPADFRHARPMAIERRFRHLGVDQSAGDAVLIVGKVK